MILFLSLTWISYAFPGAFALPHDEKSLSLQLAVSRSIDQPNRLHPRSVEMDQTIASFIEQGLCFHYFAERPPWHPDPCIEYCKNHDWHGYSGVSEPRIHHLLKSAAGTRSDQGLLV